MTMTTKEQFKQVLDKWGFPVLQETESSMVFRYQMNYVQLNITSGEESYGVTLTLSGLFTADSAGEMSLALRTCNELNYRLLQVKLYIDSDSDLIIASEYFTNQKEEKEFHLELALQSVIAAKKQFLQKYKELEEEANLASELDNLD